MISCSVYLGPVRAVQRIKPFPSLLGTEVGTKVLSKALYSPVTWMSPPRPHLSKVLPSSTLGTKPWTHGPTGDIPDETDISSLFLPVAYVIWYELILSLVHGDSPSLNCFHVLQGVKLTRPTVWLRKRHPEDHGVYMYRAVHAGHSEPLSVWMLLWCLFYFFTEKIWYTCLSALKCFW